MKHFGDDIIYGSRKSLLHTG